jgi:predicted RNase H-like HicB family nuclease
MDITIQFTVKLPIKFTKRKKWVLASCPILDIHSQGENENKAKKNLTEALSLFFTSCFERGTLDSVLKQCGFKVIHSPTIQTPKKHPAEDYINVPIPFYVDNPLRTSCHA